MPDLLRETVISLDQAAGMLRCPPERVARFADSGQGGVRPETAALRGNRAALRVLVVDDYRDAADSLALLLGVLGHETRAVYEPEAALAAARRRPFDAVLLDLVLPGMGGEELARRLRQLPGTGRSVLVCVSGYGGDEDRRRSRLAGCDHHLVKPVEAEALLRLLPPVRGGSSGPR